MKNLKKKTVNVVGGVFGAGHLVGTVISHTSLHMEAKVKSGLQSFEDTVLEREQKTMKRLMAVDASINKTQDRANALREKISRHLPTVEVKAPKAYTERKEVAQEMGTNVIPVG